MVNSFIQELEQLTQQKNKCESTELGVLLTIKPSLVIHFIEFSKLNKFIDLAAWKTTHQLEQSISIFENEWIEHRTLVLSRIKSKLGLTQKIYARKTSIIKLNRIEAYHFLLTNHTNVALKTKYNFGLMYNNEIVAIACFGPIMHKKTEGKGELSGELIRFCNKLDYTVVGGLSKLVKHFIIQYQVDDVMTYIDKDWSEGGSFIKLGFDVVGEKNVFAHYFDVEKQQFVDVLNKNNNCITIYKSGLLKLLFRVKE